MPKEIAHILIARDVLRELENHGVRFIEKEVEYLGYNPYNLGA